jgi:PAS domain S-box-containing protein
LAEKGRSRSLWDTPYPVVLIYVFVSVIWIIISDGIVFLFVSDPVKAASLSMVKGLTYIILSSLLIFFLVWKGFNIQKASQDSLQRSENRYRSMFESSPTAMLEVNMEGRIVRTNHKCLELVKMKELGLEGVSFDSLFVPGGNRIDWRKMTSLKDTLTSERELNCIDGTTLWCNVVTSLVMDEQDTPAFFVVMIEDISERKKRTALLEAAVAERTQELSQIAEKLSVTLESIGDGVVVTDSTGKVVMMNPAAKAILGDIISEQLVERLPINDAEERHHIMKPLEGSPVSVTGSTIITSATTDRIMSYTSAPMIDLAGRLDGMVVVLRDETVKVRMEEELARTRRLESVGNLAGGLAHNLNNLLTIIEGNIELASRTCPETSLNMSSAHSAVKRGRGLASRLIAFSKGGEPIKTMVQVRPLLEDVIAQVQVETPMNINLDISKNIWDVGVDKAQITQALSAIVAYPSRLPHKPAISVHARNLSQNREVEIVVTAHDLVLDEQAIKKLMEPDFETKDALELDLSIADFIISRHEGQLKIESSAGLGTNFVVRLKRASPDSKNRMVGTALGKHVLWMEDETLLRELNSNFLEALGHQGDMAPEGSVALNLFKEALRVNRPYDLVILDLVVPNGMGGMET